jgi:hypothetical protein
MTMSTQKKVSLVLICYTGFCVLYICAAVGLWGYRVWTTQNFYVKEFERLSTEARALTAEAERVRRKVAQDDTAEQPIKTANMEVLAAADEWDTGIRIGLAAWDDIMQPDAGAGDVESGKADTMVRKRWMGLMRKKIMEGMERRRELGPELRRMHLEIIARCGAHISDLQMCADS